MENRKVVFICAPYDAKDSIAHAKEIALVSHFRALIEDMYHYKTYAPGSYLTGPSKEAKDFRVEIEDVILKNCHTVQRMQTLSNTHMQQLYIRAREVNTRL